MDDDSLRHRPKKHKKHKHDKHERKSEKRRHHDSDSEGDTPARQSWFDAVINLCIPVFFSDCLEPTLLFETMYEPFLPAHPRTAFGVGQWAVVLNASELMRHPGLLVQQLRSIAPERRASMRSVLASAVPRVIYPRRTSADAAHDGVPALLPRLLHGRGRP